jgi:hypothetical protein
VNYKHVADAVEKERTAFEAINLSKFDNISKQQLAMRVVPGVDGKGNDRLQRAKTTKAVRASADAINKAWAALIGLAGEGEEGESKYSELATAMAPKKNIKSLFQDMAGLLGGNDGSQVGWGVGLTTDSTPVDESRPPLELRPKKHDKKKPGTCPEEAPPKKKLKSLPSFSSKCPPHDKTKPGQPPEEAPPKKKQKSLPSFSSKYPPEPLKHPPEPLHRKKATQRKKKATQEDRPPRNIAGRRAEVGDWYRVPMSEFFLEKKHEGRFGRGVVLSIDGGDSSVQMEFDSTPTEYFGRMEEWAEYRVMRHTAGAVDAKAFRALEAIAGQVKARDEAAGFISALKLLNKTQPPPVEMTLPPPLEMTSPPPLEMELLEKTQPPPLEMKSLELPQSRDEIAANKKCRLL